MADETLNVTIPCEPRDTKRTYLLTYSQADLTKVPTTESFVEIVLEAFAQGKSTAKLMKWAACREAHADGGKHYHLIMHLSKPRKWSPMFYYIQEKWGFNVNFSYTTQGYLRGYRYVIKENPSAESVTHSPEHPDLTSVRSPKSTKGFVTSSQNAKRRRVSKELEKAGPAPPIVTPPPTRPTAPGPSDQHTSETPRRPPPTHSTTPRLRKDDLTRFIKKNNLKTIEDLLCEAKKREVEGLPDIYNFIARQSELMLTTQIRMVWRLEGAPEIAQRKKLTRMEVVKKFLEKPCVEDCDGKWLEAAIEVLENNNINVFTFAEVMRQCLIVGRAKYFNVLLYGPRNCGKSFLLNPLEDMFRCFINPTEGKYCWVGLDKCEVAILQDLRWSPELIKWSDFLVLLEGQTVHLARPKNVFATDMTIKKSNKIPFFASTVAPLVLLDAQGKVMKKDTEMMDTRWKMIEFTYEMPKETIKRIKECPHCFSVLVTRGMEE